MENNGDFPPVKDRSWTRIEDYFESMARRRTARRSRGVRPRTEPEVPLFSLSTLPFLILIAGLAVLAIAIAVSAWPGSQQRPQGQAASRHEQGVAPKGWFQEAQKEFRGKS